MEKAYKASFFQGLSKFLITRPGTIILVSIILLCSCTKGTRLARDKNKKTGSVVRSIHLDAGWHKIAYQGYNSACRETGYECDLSLCDSSVRKTKLKEVPEGGRVIIYFSSTTLQESTPGNFDYVVKDASGNVITSHSGDTSSVPSYIEKAWYDTDEFEITQPVT